MPSSVNITLREPLCAADQQLLAKLLLKRFELGGKRGLGKVQRRGGCGNALLPRHGQKIVQYAEVPWYTRLLARSIP